MVERSFPPVVIEMREWQEDTEESKLLSILANEDCIYKYELMKAWRTLEKHESSIAQSTTCSFRFQWVQIILHRILSA